MNRSSQYRLLLVDDDKSLVQLLRQYLEHEGLIVEVAHSAEEAEQLFAQGLSVDLIVLDIMMPGKSGLEFLQMLRPANSIPVLMLTGRGDDIDRILGLEMGADDYLTKPCNPRELFARIKAILRRSHQAQLDVSVLRVASLLLDAGQRIATFQGKPLDLTSTEFNVLKELMLNAGHLVNKESLNERVLHRKLTLYDRSLDVHVSRLRQKLVEIAGEQGADLIKTIRGQGYQMVKDSV